MLRHKPMKEKGKFSFTKYFQKFQPGDSVAVVQELSLNFGYKKKLQGRTGKVVAQRGEAYCVEIYDFDKAKKYFIRPVHLKKILGAK